MFNFAELFAAWFYLSLYSHTVFPQKDMKKGSYLYHDLNLFPFTTKLTLERDHIFRVVTIWWIYNDIFIKVLFILFEDPFIYFECLDQVSFTIQAFFTQKILIIYQMVTTLNRRYLSTN